MEVAIATRIGVEPGLRSVQGETVTEGANNARQLIRHAVTDIQKKARNLGMKPIMTTEIEKESMKIIIVDDEESIGRILSLALGGEGYICNAIKSAENALLELEHSEYSLVISDINMPGMNGLQLLESIIEKDRDIAVIMLTGLPELDTAVYCLKLGAYDYLTKPIDTTELSISVSRALERRRLLIREKQYQEDLEMEVKNKTLALAQTQKEVIYRLALAAEYRDENTWEHLLRIAESSFILARRLGLSSEFCEMIHIASPLHDIGKIGIPDSILLKPGRLSHDEYELMKRHTVIGTKILQGSESALIEMACDIAAAHHEKYNGEGYFSGKKKEEIPLAARIVAVADVFDALTSKRPYKEAWSWERSVEVILEGRGTHFDPDVVDAFARSVDAVTAIRQQYNNALCETPSAVECRG